MYGCAPRPGGRYCVNALRTRLDSIDTVNKNQPCFVLHSKLYRTSINASVNSIKEYAAMHAAK